MKSNLIQAYKPTSLQAYKPTSLQAYKPTSLKFGLSSPHFFLSTFQGRLQRLCIYAPLNFFYLLFQKFIHPNILLHQLLVRDNYTP